MTRRPGPARPGRRAFLVRVSRLGPLALLGPWAVPGCGGGGGWSPERIRQRRAALDPDLDCSDTTGLWPAEIRTRTDNEYTERSGKPDQFCFDCNNFVEPQAPGGCGSCRTVKGPINPGGWCKAWAERAR